MPTATKEEKSTVVPKLLTVSEAAKMLTCSNRTVWRLAKSGELRLVRLGRAVRLDPNAIAAFVDRGGSKPEAEDAE